MLFAQHPDDEAVRLVARGGQKAGPATPQRDRRRPRDPSRRTIVQCLAGTAPVSFQSGQIAKVHLRRACNKHLRHAVHLWADLSGTAAYGRKLIMSR